MSPDNKLNRRSFLRKTSLAAGVGIVAPNIVSATVLGRNGAVSPNNRVTMGFIGVGTQGSGHLLGGAWTYLTGPYQQPGKEFYARFVKPDGAILPDLRASTSPDREL